MTHERILAIAAKHQQYPGAKEVTLRGSAIVDVVTACLAEALAEYRYERAKVAQQMLSIADSCLQPIRPRREALRVQRAAEVRT